MTKKSIISIITFLFLFSGCATKDHSNKSASFWYQKIIESINGANLTEADSYFLSLKSEHRRSDLIGEAILLLAKAHLDFEEYQVANFYYDTYVKLYGDSNKKEYAAFMKIKSNYYAFNRALRDQKLLQDTIQRSEEFLITFDGSIYTHEVKMIVARMELAQISLNDKISHLYAKLDKPTAAQMYQEKNEQKSLYKSQYEDAPTPWYRWLFE
jgi:outer membrane protein assembly factor BamD